jgi:membrane protein DedA with SNARE-associated domain
VPEFLAHLAALLRAGGPWLGPILAAAAFAEAMVMIGVFVPVTPALLAIGAAVASRMIGPWLLVWVMAGAFLGNAASYELGRSLQARGVAPPRLPAKARAVAQALFLRHGAVSIVVARFLGPPATVAPFLAGWSRLPRGRFLAASAAASLLWPLATAAIGFVGVWVLRR